ncbi:MAG: TlpA family protein disulfide reductase, partial [Chitinophagaceae bacterium]
MHTILSFQAEGRVRHQLIANIWKISRSGTPDYSKPTLQNYYRNYLQINLETLKDASPINSPHYMAYLYHAEWNRHKLFSTNLERGTGFKPVFELIKTGYKGKFRDQLLFQAIKSLSEYFHADIAANMHALTRCLTDGNYLHALKTWDQQQQAAYPFELEDTDGKIHNLKDFKGKVLILDFWFTHCTWCVRLNAAMHSIMEKYKRDPDVVFLSVCLDVKKESWKRSIAGGKYTSEGVLNLFTNGLGRAHPMMAYYNFVGAPQQLIIGKDGRVVSSKPPRPDMGMNYKVKRAGEKGALKPDAKGTLNNPPAKAFIALIETALGARST